MTEETFQFNPITGQAMKVTSDEACLIREKMTGKKSIILMCCGCKCIIHESVVEKHLEVVRDINGWENPGLKVSSLKNVRIQLSYGNINLMCNECSSELGTIDKEELQVILIQDNIRFVSFNWQKKKIGPQKERITVGSYSGLHIRTLEKLVQELTYTKCRRYQETMERLRTSMKDTIKGFQNFILLYNVCRAEQELKPQNQLMHQKREKLSCENMSKTDGNAIKIENKHHYTSKESNSCIQLSKTQAQTFVTPNSSRSSFPGTKVVELAMIKEESQ